MTPIDLFCAYAMIGLGVALLVIAIAYYYIGE